jgi:diguanylate cyclase (GGDEF)-like protein
MFKFRGQLRQLRNWWFRVCTGNKDSSALDEELYRQRILVMASSSWLMAVIFLTLAVPLIVDLTPNGKQSAEALFVITGAGVLISMLILRFGKNRVLALNILLFILACEFAAACLIFGGTASPTYPILLLIPVLAGIAGSVNNSIAWGVTVFIFWTLLLVAEKSGLEFTQIIKTENYRLAMLMALGATSLAVVSVLVVYAEMNKALRYDLQASNRELGHLSSHDQLTGLPNRRFYDERMGVALHRAAEHNSMLGLLIIDLNDFKKLNDTYGHGAGDKLLVTVAKRLQDTLRETDLIARLGGDEFAAVIEDASSMDEVTRIAHKISQSIEQPLLVRQHPLQFSASIGVAMFPSDGRQKHELEEQADKAMYFAKKRGIRVALSGLEDKNELYPARIKPIRS